MVYFDSASTTKPSKGALEAFTDCAAITYANPSSQHSAGKAAREAVEDVRRIIAATIGSHADEIVFTSGGTEAANLAILGACAANRGKNKIIISAVEHPAVYKTCSMLRESGYRVVTVSATLDGTVDEKSLASEIDDTVAIVSFMAVNNETGTVFPIRKISRIVKSIDPGIPVHTDAVQALCKIPLDVNDLGVDLLSVSAHKVHGIKGAGALYIRNGTSVTPLYYGGEQERGMRPGTEAVPLIAAFGYAVSEAVANLDDYNKLIGELKSRLVFGLANAEGVVVNTKEGGIPHIVNFSVPGRKPGDVLTALSGEGYCVSRGAACKTNHEHGPSMLMSFGLPVGIADTALRVSFSHENNAEEVEGFVRALVKILICQ